jgi:hypothetical protein
MNSQTFVILCKEVGYKYTCIGGEYKPQCEARICMSPILGGQEKDETDSEKDLQETGCHAANSIQFISLGLSFL